MSSSGRSRGPVWEMEDRVLVRLGRWLAAPSVRWRRRVWLAAPSVRWRRRVCRQGGRLVHVPALHTQSKPSLHTRSGGMAADWVST
ncbi:hypothetical protein PJI17_10915 [Mycobacterium kansasii]